MLAAAAANTTLIEEKQLMHVICGQITDRTEKEGQADETLKHKEIN